VAAFVASVAAVNEPERFEDPHKAINLNIATNTDNDINDRLRCQARHRRRTHVLDRRLKAREGRTQLRGLTEC
jgi:hypothetical protein